MVTTPTKKLSPLRSGDALVIVDVQKDFLPGGALPVPRGDEIIPALNTCLALFLKQQLPIFATRDWHPPRHCSFKSQGGPWPPHCIAGTDGAAFASSLLLPESARIISKATQEEVESYSGFSGTNLQEQLQRLGSRRLFIGGLATDYCVLHTVMDGLSLGYQTILLGDAVRAVNLSPSDGESAVKKMIAGGAITATISDLET